MGLDVNRFPEPVDDEFKCSICLNVLVNPIHGNCGHVFCRECIFEWFDRSVPGSVRNGSSSYRPSRVGTCPVDRKTLYRDQLIDAALPFKNILNRLKIKCDFEEYGCTKISRLESLVDHVKKCNFNPEEVIECPNGCAKLFERRDLVKRPHNCIKELQSMIIKQETIIKQLEEEKSHKEQTTWKLLLLTIFLVIVISLLTVCLLAAKQQVYTNRIAV